MSAKIGVMVATPVRHWRGTDAFHPNFKAVLQILATLSTTEDCPYEFTLAVMEGGIVRARNVMAHRFKASGCKFLVTLDDDLEDETPGKMVDNILRLLGHRKPVVAALFTTREARAHWTTNFMHEVELQKDGLLQVIETATGLKCVHVQVFTELDRLLGDKIQYSDRDTGELIMGYYQHGVVRTDLKPDGDLMSEDYFFCWLARQCRIGLFVDTTIKLLHRGGDGTLYPLMVDGKRDWPPIPGLEEAT